MNALGVIGCMSGGGVIGAILGAWYGFATDKSDFPILAAMTCPVGAVIGGTVGTIVGAVLFA